MHRYIFFGSLLCLPFFLLKKEINHKNTSNYIYLIVWVEVDVAKPFPDVAKVSFSLVTNGGVVEFSSPSFFKRVIYLDQNKKKHLVDFISPNSLSVFCLEQTSTILFPYSSHYVL